MADHTPEDDDTGWTEVVSRKEKREKPQFQTQEQRLHAVDHYWNGFDEAGNEKWYIELSNGSIITKKDNNYAFWAKRCYSGR